MTPLRDLPRDQRPRERLLQLGPRALADYELLAIVIGGGRRGESALAVAARLLRHDGLHGLRRMGLRTMMRESGVGLARAAQICAALEIGLRLDRPRQRPALAEPDAAYAYVRGRFDQTVEELFAVFLDRRLQPLGEAWLARGGRSGLALQPADVLRPAVQAGASALLIAHNHPGGDPTPSPDDVETTRRLRSAAEFVGVELVDHLVIGDNGFVSLRLAGYVGA